MAPRRRGLITACVLTCALLVVLAARAAAPVAATPFRGGEYRVSGKDWETVLFTFHVSRDLRSVKTQLTPQYRYENCRLGGRRVSLWTVFELSQPMRLTPGGSFSRLGAWPHLTGRFSADGTAISVRLRNRAFEAPGRAGTVRCPALDRRFEALVHLPAGEYAGSTAQGRRISFTLGGPGRKRVGALAFEIELPCDPAGSVAHAYSGLSGGVDVAGLPELDLSTGGPFEGGTRRASVHAEWLGATVSGRVSASWVPPEPDPEDETSPYACETSEDGVPFTARLVRRAPGT